MIYVFIATLLFSYFDHGWLFIGFNLYWLFAILLGIYPSIERR